MPTNGNEPANGYGFTTADGSSHIEEKGLTKREAMAIAAMEGFIATVKPVYQDEYNICAERSVKQADALIKALNE